MSEIDCVTRCQSRGCAVAVAIESRGQCQMAIVYEDGTSGSQVDRVLGLETGARVWKAEVKTATLINSTWMFDGGSAGSVGSIQQLRINVTGCYRIEAAGASGGAGSAKPSGRGALIAGDFRLTAGTELAIVAGQMGGTCCSRCGAGGGGGSFVYTAAAGSPQLLIAAGGGGGGCSNNAGTPGSAGPNGTNSVGSVQIYSGLGGVNGQPGANNPSQTDSYSSHGGCGAGWLGKAIQPRRNTEDGERGGSLTDGWTGGAGGVSSCGDGGFGGGGGGGNVGSLKAETGAGGGGGGFSGGGAGTMGDQGGGGGGSFCGGSGCTGTAGGNTGTGKGFVRVWTTATCD